MALTSIVSLRLKNLARRGDAFARNVFFTAQSRDELLLQNLAKRGDLVAQRHIKGNSASAKSKLLVARLSRKGDLVALGIGSITEDKHTQTITFAQPAPVELIDADTPAVVTLSGSSSAGLPVTFALTSGPATLDGNTLTITDEGDVVVEARQTGGPNHLAATPVSRTITVTIAP